MFKVLLVDDEPHVRQGIKMMIPWDKLGCEVAGEANDGDDGLTKIMTLKPDIVIADIKMPGKTGIEMTEAANALGFKGKILILSGYSDFSYAKTAIALGVENFILKPVDEDELADAISSACEKLTRERERRYRQEIGRRYLNEQLIKGLFSGSEDMIAEAAGRFDFDSYCAAVISCDKTASAADKYALAKELIEKKENADAVTIDISGAIGVLFKGYKREDILSVLREAADIMGESAYITAGEYVSSLIDIRRSYSTAEYLYRCRFIYRHFGIALPEMVHRSYSGDSEDYAASIYAYMEINDTEKMNSAFDSFLLSMQSLGNTPEKAKVSAITLAMDIKRRIAKSAADKRNDELLSDEFISSLGEADSLYDMVESMKKRLGSVSDESFGRSRKSTMERILRYIHSNYNQELRLEMLAGIFGYNSAYLGKVFHRYTGENFNNYLDEIRITEAKRLLSSEDYKVYEVAEMVGYSNINYFHNKFKKYVGMSPLSFKKQHGRNE